MQSVNLIIVIRFLEMILDELATCQIAIVYLHVLSVAYAAPISPIRLRNTETHIDSDRPITHDKLCQIFTKLHDPCVCTIITIYVSLSIRGQLVKMLV